jgi:hypothetical protein
METDAIRVRYKRREATIETARYSLLNPDAWQSVHEKQRAIFRLFVRLGLIRLTDLSLLDAG